MAKWDAKVVEIQMRKLRNNHLYRTENYWNTRNGWILVEMNEFELKGMTSLESQREKTKDVEMNEIEIHIIEYWNNQL